MVEVALLSDGFFFLDMGFLVYGKASYYGNLYKAALKPLLIKTEDEVVLVDSGMGDLPESYQKFYTIEREQTLTSSLAQRGIAPEEVTAVINTHLHMDHAGNNRLFSNAKTYVQEQELQYAHNPHRFQRGAYIEEFLEGLDFITLKGDYTFSEDVDIIVTPGHTPGHQSVVVHGACDYIYCGDTAPLRENLEKRNIVGILFNPVDALNSLDRLKQIEGVHIFSHDNEQLTL
ncbi:MAG: N-acyl homoserine lactonase family protein [Theionarchaea archaeon]|nr:N-acyl homoserine lactonase family protein [Theionarchaea archaeon]MBU7037021.1 N-acyl homoserine lactonase family protein [Theionarchaea archaeon]